MLSSLVIYKENDLCFISGVIPEEVVWLASDHEGFAGEQHVLSLSLLSRDVENEGKNSWRIAAVIQASLTSPEGCGRMFSAPLSRESRDNRNTDWQSAGISLQFPLVAFMVTENNLATAHPCSLQLLTVTVVSLTFQKHELNYKWWGCFFVCFKAS